ADKRLVKLLVHFLAQLGFAAGTLAAEPFHPAFFLLHGGPFLLGLERHKELRVIEPGWVGAVVRPANLSYNRLHLRVTAHDGTRGPNFIGDLLERAVHGEGASDPQVTFLQLGHELVTEEWQDAQGSSRQDRKNAEGQPAVIEAALELPQIAGLQPADQEILPGWFEPLVQEAA